MAKDTKVVSSTNLADIVDLSPDGQKMLQTLLSGGGVGAGGTNGSAGPGSVVTTTDGMTLSITTASAHTIGRQQDSASSSDEMISWQTADGKSGTFEVEETDSFTTDMPLVPLSPQLQSTQVAPGVAATSTNVTVVESGRQGSGLPVRVGGTATQVPDKDRAALELLEAASAQPSWQHSSRGATTSLAV